MSAHECKFFITRHSATGILGYELLHGQELICRNSDYVLAVAEASITRIVKTVQSLATLPINSSEHPTIFPGLIVRYDVLSETNETIAFFNKIYGHQFDSKIIAYKNGQALFEFFPQSATEFYNSKNQIIASVEEDLSFERNPLSIDDKRYFFHINDDENVFLFFHAFVSAKLQIFY